MPIINQSNAPRKKQMSEYLTEHAVMLGDDNSVEVPVKGRAATITMPSTSDYYTVLKTDKASLASNNGTANMRIAFHVMATSDRQTGILDLHAARNNDEISYELHVSGTSPIYKMRILVPKTDPDSQIELQWAVLDATGQITLSVLESDVAYTVYESPTVSTYNSNYHYCTDAITPDSGYHIMSGDLEVDELHGKADEAWNTISGDGYSAGEASYYGTLLAVASDGKLWKLRGSAKSTFKLPLTAGVSPVSQTAGTSSAVLDYSERNLSLGVLTNATTQGAAFSIANRTSAGAATSAWTVGDSVFVEGNIDSNGYFVPSGYIRNVMLPGYTSICIGRVHKTGYWTPMMQNLTAYTLDTDGKIVKVDGAPTGGTDVTYTATQTSGAEIGKLTINGTATTLYAPELSLEMNDVTLLDWED